MKKVLIALCLTGLMQQMSIASQFGGMDAGALNTQYMKDLRFHEAQTRAKRSAITHTTRPEPDKLSNSELKSVIFINNSSVSSEQLLTLVQDKINKPMTPESVAEIRKDIMKYYQSLGYYSAVATISSQNSENGELVIDISEGGKNSISIEDNQ